MAVAKLVVGAVIVDQIVKPSLVLAARRTGPASLRGRWEFPGGKVDGGEMPADALIRELREELGVQVDLGDELLPAAGHTWPISDELEMRLWFAVITDGEPIPIDSHDELRWLDADSLESVDWLDADVKVLPHLSASLMNSWSS